MEYVVTVYLLYINTEIPHKLVMKAWLSEHNPGNYLKRLERLLVN